MILIAGDGRNVGKTLYASKVINRISRKQNVIGIKISPHIHDDYNKKSLIYKDEKVVVCEEKEITNKDSSRMLQAGSKRVFFIMSKQKDLENAFSKIIPFLNDEIIVCESGGLHEFVKPGKFIFIKNNFSKVEKKEYLNFDPILFTRHGTEFIKEQNKQEEFNIQKKYQSKSSYVRL